MALRVSSFGDVGRVSGVRESATVAERRTPFVPGARSARAWSTGVVGVPETTGGAYGRRRREV